MPFLLYRSAFLHVFDERDHLVLKDALRRF